MAFDAGAVIGRVTLDSSDFVKGSQNVNKHSQSMTKSMFSAQLAYDLFRKAVSFAANALKDSVSAYTESEMVTKQLETVIKSTGGAAGVTAKSVLDLASALQQTTNFEDDAIVVADNLLLTFTNIGKDIFPQATETMLDMSQALGQDLKSSAIQLGKALQDPILGVTALRRVGVNFNAAQTEVIKNLVNTGRAAEAQKLILKELQAEFGGSARAARDTFGGAVISLNNNVGDLQETFGSYITSAGRPFVENMSDMVKGINDFLTSKEGMQQVADVLKPLTGALYVAWNIAGKLFDVLKKYAGGIFDSLAKGFETVAGKGNESTVAFDLLGGAVKIVSAGFAISGKVVNYLITSIADLINAVGKSVDVLGAFGAALTDPLNEKKWQAVADKGKIAVDAFATFGTNIAANIGDIVTTTIAEINSFTTDAKINGKELASEFSNGVNTMDAALKKLGSTSETTLTVWQRTKQWVDKNLKKPEIDPGKTVEERFRAWADTHGITMEKIKQQNETTMINLKEKWEAVAGDISNAMQGLWNNITGALMQSLENEQTLEDNRYKKKKAQIEASVLDEAEKKKQLEALEKDHAAKTAEIKKKQFESQKAVSIISAIIATALGVANAISQAQLFPFNFILAGIVAAAGAIQIATIASQPTPEFAAGTGMGTYQGLALVGERGPELVNFGQPAQIFPADQTAGMLGGGIRQENNFYGDINSEIDLDRASAQQARKLRTLLRAS